MAQVYSIEAPRRPVTSGLAALAARDGVADIHLALLAHAPPERLGEVADSSIG
jgi:hypothetical protein